MIELRTGDLLDSGAQAIVCTVNTKGAMGKGLALSCAERFVGLLRAYTDACERGEIRTGSMWTFDTGLLIGPRLVICFPTKEHWIHPSRIEWVEDGLAALARTIRSEGLESVAVPPLGCGLGGLDWRSVKARIYSALNDLHATVELYPPR